jgi:hypothetical protein
MGQETTLRLRSSTSRIIMLQAVRAFDHRD